jgi:hypothetical protein
MPAFLFAYRRPQEYVPGRPDAVAAWTAWFEELGSSVTDRGNPIFESVSLGHCGEDTKLGGYSLVTAQDLDTALVLAKGCPALREGAGIEIGLITEIGRQDGTAS